MTFSINEFRSNLVGDGARPNLFNIQMILPPALTVNSLNASRQLTFMAKSAQLPGSSVGSVPLYYFGREMKFAGNRTFPDWTITVINDENFVIRNALETWMNSLNSHEGNLRNASGVAPVDYSVDALVTQYGKAGPALKQYNFIGMFPIDISPVDLDWGNNDTIEEYSVTFVYQMWTSNTTT